MNYHRLILHALAASCLFAIGLCKLDKDFAGPYEIIIKGLEKCHDSGTDQLRADSNFLRKYNRTLYLYSTNITVPYDVGDNVDAHVLVAVFSNGRYSNNFFNKNFGGLCTTLKAFLPEFANKLFNKLGVESCPVKKGTYELCDLDFNLKLNWPMIPYGKYRAEISALEKGGKKIGCKALYVDIVPKN